jgi:hypothetical protein
MSRKSYLVCMVATLYLFLVLVPHAGAEMVRYVISFSASNFGEGAPYTDVSGSYTITLDPSVDTTASTMFDSASLTPSLAAVVGWNYIHDLQGGLVEIGGGSTGSDIDTVWQNTNDFIAVVAQLSGTPQVTNVSYTITGSMDLFIAKDISFSVTATAVPLPATMLLLGSGLIPVAWARRRKREGA